jgi:hypothetical protein
MRRAGCSGWTPARGGRCSRGRGSPWWSPSCRAVPSTMALQAAHATFQYLSSERSQFTRLLSGSMIGTVDRTATTESRAATARMSAHDTVRGHSASSRALMVSTTPNPLSDPAFGPAPFSPVKLPVSSSRTDASQPWRTYRQACTARHLTCSQRFVHPDRHGIMPSRVLRST